MKTEKKNFESASFQLCRKLKRNYFADTYPKTCNCCGEFYENRDEYLSRTTPLEEPSKLHSIGPKRVIEYRNCCCGTTLVTEFINDRDMSTEGEKARQDYRQKKKFLVENGVDDHRAIKILLEKIRNSL